MYIVILTPDDNGTLLVTCPDLPEVTTFGEDEEDGMQRAADAIEEALAARIARREEIPAPRLGIHQIVEEPPAARVVERSDAPASPATLDQEVELAARVTERGDVPHPAMPAEYSPRFLRRRLGVPDSQSQPLNLRVVWLPPLTMAKVELYRAARAQEVSKAELARRLGWHGPQVDRLFDLNHRSTIAQLDQALRAIGKRLAVSIHDAA